MDHNDIAAMMQAIDGRPMLELQHRRRRIRVDKTLPLAEKQSIAGRHTSEAVTRRTDERLAATLTEMQREGAHITQQAVAVRAGVSLRTVSGRWAALRKALLRP